MSQLRKADFNVLPRSAASLEDVSRSGDEEVGNYNTTPVASSARACLHRTYLVNSMSHSTTKSLVLFMLNHFQSTIAL